MDKKDIIVTIPPINKKRAGSEEERIVIPYTKFIRIETTFTSELPLDNLIQGFNSVDNKTVTKTLISFNKEITRIQHFLKNGGFMGDTKCIIEEYLLASPRCNEIFTVLKINERNRDFVRHVFNVLTGILTVNKFEKTIALNDFIAKEIIKSWMHRIYPLLNNRDPREMVVALRLLIAITDLGPHMTRFLFQAFDFMNIKPMSLGKVRFDKDNTDPDAITREEDPRTYYIRFCMALLSTGDDNITRSFMRRIPVLAPIFNFIETDPTETAMYIFSVLTENVFLRPSITVKEKNTLIKSPFVEKFVGLLKSKSETTIKATSEFLSLIIDSFSMMIINPLLEIIKEDQKIYKGTPFEPRRRSDFIIDKIYIPTKTHREEVMLDTLVFLNPGANIGENKKLALKILREFPELYQEFMLRNKDMNVKLNRSWLAKISFLISAVNNATVPQMRLKKDALDGPQRPPLSLIEPLLHFTCPMDRIFFTHSFVKKPALVMSRGMDLLIVILKKSLKVLEMLDEANQALWGTFRSMFRGGLKSRLPSVDFLATVRNSAMKMSEKPRSFILGQYYLVMSIYFKAFPEIIKECHFSFKTLLEDCWLIDSLAQYRLLTLVDSLPYTSINFETIFSGMRQMTLPESHPLIRDRARRYMFKVVSKFGIVPTTKISKIEFTLWSSAISSRVTSAFFTDIMKADLNKTGYYAAKTPSLMGRLLMCAKDLVNTLAPEESEDSAEEKRVYYNTVRVLLEPLLNDEEKAISPIVDVPKSNFLLKVCSTKDEATLMESLDQLQIELLPAALISITHYLSDVPELAFNLIYKAASRYLSTVKNNMISKSISKLIPVALLTNTKALKNIIENSSADIFYAQKMFRDLGCEECDTFGKFIEEIMGSSERTTEFADYFANHCSDEALQSFIENTADGEVRQGYIYCFATALELSIERRILFKFLTRETLIKALKMVENSTIPINGGKLDHSIRTIFDHTTLNNSFYSCRFNPYKECSEGMKVYTKQFFVYKSPTDDYIQTIIHFIEQSKTSIPVLKFAVKLFESRKQFYFPRICAIWNTILDYISEHKSALIDEAKIIPALLSDILDYPQAKAFSLLHKLFSVASTKELVKGTNKVLKKYFDKDEPLNNQSLSLMEALLDCYMAIDPYETMKRKIESRDYSKEEYPTESYADNNDDLDEKEEEEEEEEDETKEKSESESEEEDEDIDMSDDEDIDMNDDEDTDESLGTIKLNYTWSPEDPAKTKRMMEGFYVSCLESLLGHLVRNPDGEAKAIHRIVTVLRRRIDWMPIEDLRNKKSGSGKILMKVLISIAQKPVGRDPIFFVKDIIKKVFATWDEKHRHKRLKTIHKAIVENIDSYHMHNVSWEDLASLLHLMYSLEPSLCEKDIDPVLVTFAEEYTVTASKKDRKILCLLRLLDKNGSHLSRIGYAWGSHARSILEGQETDIYRAILSDASGLLNETIIKNTIEHYPYARRMDEDDGLMDEEDPLPEEGYLEDEKGETDMNDDDTGDKYNAEVYDPVYLLPIILNAINHMPEGGIILFIDIKALHLVLCSLSTEDKTLLKLSYAILFGFMKIISSNSKKELQERSQVSSLLECVRNSVTSTEMRFPVIFTNFAVQALSIIVRPGDMLYGDINKFILSEPRINLGKVPFIDKALGCIDTLETIQKERHWALELIESSIKPFENDYQLWFKNRLHEKLFLEFQTSSTDKKTHLIILSIIEKAVKCWGWGGKKEECSYLLSWLCSTNLLMRYPNEVTQIIISIATQPNKDNVKGITRNLFHAASVLLRSSFIEAGIKVLGCITDDVSKVFVPAKLFELFAKVLAMTVESDDVDTAHTVAKIIISCVEPTQERPAGLNDLMRNVIATVPNKAKYVSWIDKGAKQTKLK